MIPIETKTIQEMIETLTSELQTLDAVIKLLTKARSSSLYPEIEKELCAASKLLWISRIRIARE